MTSRKLRRGDAGLTLVEIMIALAILVLALIGLFAVILHTTRHNAMQRENQAAMRAAEQKIEEMMNSTFTSIFVNYNSGTGPGPTFDVTGLNRIDSSTPVGQISFPTNAGGTQLWENMTSVHTGMSSNIDLNGVNGVETGVDVSGTYKILPVTIQMTWESIHGQRTMTYRHIFLQR